jgi:hypothetical protein
VLDNVPAAHSVQLEAPVSNIKIVKAMNMVVMVRINGVID